MADSNVNRVKLGQQGRLVIPAGIRRRLALEPGDDLLARVEGGKLVIEASSAGLTRAREHFRDVPKGVSLVDELIADRRLDAKLEEERWRRTAGG